MLLEYAALDDKPISGFVCLHLCVCVCVPLGIGALKGTRKYGWLKKV